MILKILKNSYKYIKNIINSQYNQNNSPYPVNYQGHDRYNNQLFIGINDDNKMQLWAIIKRGLIHNCGYYESYRNSLIIKKITNGK